MLRTICLTVGLLLACASSWGSESSPEQFIRQLIDAFNSENLEVYQSNFHYPYSRINNGRIEILTDEKTPSVDYTALKKSGWVKSKINELAILDRGEASAIVRMNFSRVNAAGQDYLTANFFYTLTKSEDGWKVISWSIANAVPGGFEDK